jgi:hypothetical protein
VTQDLWPQCQSCWKIQGSKVKSKSHFLINHHSLRLYHFAPAIALLLSQNHQVQKIMDPLIRSTHKLLKKSPSIAFPHIDIRNTVSKVLNIPKQDYVRPGPKIKAWLRHES